MNHSLIPLLKFHPEQPWPHREKEGYWRAKWDEGSGDQAHQSRPCQSRVRQKTPTPHSPISPPLLSSQLGLVLQIHRSWQKTQNDQSWRGYQSAGGWRWWLTPSPLFSLWPNAGKGWGSGKTALLSSAPHPNLPFRYLLNLLCWNHGLCRNRLSVGQHTSFHAWQAMKREREKRHNSKTIPDKCLEKQQE